MPKPETGRSPIGHLRDTKWPIHREVVWGAASATSRLSDCDRKAWRRECDSKPSFNVVHVVSLRQMASSAANLVQFRANGTEMARGS